MSKFDRFTKAFAMADFHQAFKILLGDEIDIAHARCNVRTCNKKGDGCGAGCFCIEGFLCFP